MSESVPPSFHLTRGETKLVISVPHAGTYLPPEVAAQLNPLGLGVIDTDWHVDALYGFAAEMGATVLTATHSRTVVDLNRSPAGGKLYPGQAETTVCPTETFDGDPLYSGSPPSAEEIARRVGLYWEPYHAALRAELDRVHKIHGVVHLLDGHSIRASIPRLFEGTLPDLNYGTNNGASAHPALVEAAMAATAPHGFSQVLNGRFRGGHITRSYGDPTRGIHAIQLEMAQSTYMDRPQPYDPARGARLIAALRDLVAVLSQEGVLF